MTDLQIVQAIKDNDEYVWAQFYRQNREHFIATVKKVVFAPMFSEEDWEDILQDSCMVLMAKVKEDAFVVARNGGLFSYFVEIGKGKARNLVRKKRPVDSEQTDRIADNLHREDADFDITIEEKQQTQNEFLDRALDSLPDTCKMIFRYFYWDNRPMNEIANIIGSQNADSVKTQKNRCMNKFKTIARALLDSDEYAEEVVRAAVERAALRELLEDERIYAKKGQIRSAAFTPEDKDDERDQ